MARDEDPLAASLRRESTPAAFARLISAGGVLRRAAFGVTVALSVASIALWAITRTPPATTLETASLPFADEATLLSTPTDHVTLFRFAPAPRIVVAIFPTLHEQALALNRVAAFIERPGVPRNHVLGDAALRAAIGQGGIDFDTYYLGHDYRAGDLARFYATASADGVPLNATEQALKTRLAEAGLFQPGQPQALISLPPEGSNILDPPARAAILDHELSHGAYFTNQAYEDYVKHFWRNLTAAERAAFRRFLGEQGYDTGNDDLMRNETQAYLVFTTDPRIFDPSRLALPEALKLREIFLRGLPTPWLRNDAK
jgi:hypothetical protein